MKTRNYFLIAIFSLLTFIFVGCEKETVGPEPFVPIPVVSTFGITIEVVGGISDPQYALVDSGESQTITLTARTGYEEIPDSLYINGKLETPTNSVKLEGIAENYKINAVFKMTKDLKWLKQNPWSTIRWQSRLVSSSVWDIDITAKDSMAVETYIFDAETSRFDSWCNKIHVGDGYYELSKDSLIIGGGIKAKIIELSADYLVIEFRSEFISAPYVKDPSKDFIIRETYAHIPNLIFR